MFSFSFLLVLIFSFFTLTGCDALKKSESSQYHVLLEEKFSSDLENWWVEGSEKVWIHLNLAWVGFFIAMGAINLYVAFNFEENTWVNFKLFGMMGLTILFVIAQSIYLMRYIKEDTEEQQAATATISKSSD